MRLPFSNKKQPANHSEKAPSEGKGFLESLKKGLSKTHKILNTRIDDLILGTKEINHDFIEELEEILISADLGVNTTQKLIEQVRKKVKRGEAERPEVVKGYLKESIYEVLAKSEQPLIHPQQTPFVIMVIGVNGTGKTTTIAKMASHYKALGKDVLLVAADTFRAAAIDQLEIWSKRINSGICKQKSGSDPSAVVFDALATSQKRSADVVIIDTAGRMHTKVNLMEELKKIKRVADRQLSGAPHEILLVIDATTGQNALSQAKLFHEALDITGIALTKLDGTAKGGIIVAIADEFTTPIRYIALGEDLNDFKPFRAKEFVDALFNET